LLDYLGIIFCCGHVLTPISRSIFIGDQ
jgi:hypothetical protein